MGEIGSGVLGFPRLGRGCELPRALSAFFAGQLGEGELLSTARALRRQSWAVQRRSGASWVTVGDFSLYDHVLDLSLQLGAVPRRFRGVSAARDVQAYFRMARGEGAARPLRAVRWFDTRYHYLAPELQGVARFEYQAGALVSETREARSLGYTPRPALLGPISFLLASREGAPLMRLRDVLPAYVALLRDLRAHGADAVQLDEPRLTSPLDASARAAFGVAYAELARTGVELHLASYFGALGENLQTSLELPVRSVHLDGLVAPEEARAAARRLRPEQALSLGVVDGRNVWRAELNERLALAEQLLDGLGSERLLLAPTCSLLHVPLDVLSERLLDPEIAGWLSFAAQKLEELSLLRRALRQGRSAVALALEASREQHHQRQRSAQAYRARVRARLARWDGAAAPGWGRAGREPVPALVPGAERSHARVEALAEVLEGMALTQNGWVQCRGEVCIRPPLLFGDVERTRGSSLSEQRAPGASGGCSRITLPGPHKMLAHSFVRDDEPLEHSRRALSLALADEARALRAAGALRIELDELAAPPGSAGEQAQAQRG